jgi:hypothetical protein
LPQFHAIDRIAGVIGVAYHCLVISRGLKTVASVYSQERHRLRNRWRLARKRCQRHCHGSGYREAKEGKREP